MLDWLAQELQGAIYSCPTSPSAGVTDMSHLLSLYVDSGNQSSEQQVLYKWSQVLSSKRVKNSKYTGNSK